MGDRQLWQFVEGMPEFFSIEVTNLGRRPTSIVNLMMRDWLCFRVKRFGFGSQMVMTPPSNPWSSRVPTTIGDGERAQYFAPWREFEAI
jgi:hypothetical protein